MTEKYININNLSVSEILYTFINEEVIPETKINKSAFWSGFDKSAHQLVTKNKELIKIRERIQIDIDRWHIDNKDKTFDKKKYKKLLEDIGYLKTESESFKINTKNIDEEISTIAGPQLVVPIMNSRYVLNAANARWMSLYDSLYGTDVIESEESASGRYDPERGLEVIKYTKKFLDNHFPLTKHSWKNVTEIQINNNNLNLICGRKNEFLKNEEKFIGYRKDQEKLTAVILKQ